MRTTEFDVSAYFVHFESVFKDHDVSTAFQTFLKKENNYAFEFIKNVEKLEKQFTTNKNREQLLEAIEDIWVEHLSMCAKSEINLSGKLKQKIIKTKATKDSSHEALRTIFSEAKDVVTNELSMDAFPRFLKSKYFLKIVNQVCNKLDVMTSKVVHEFPYKDEDFLVNEVTERDWQFFKAIIDDPSWKPVLSEDTVKIYNTQVNFLPYVSYFEKANWAKLEFEIPYPMKTAIMESLVEIDPLSKNPKLLKKYQVGELKETDVPVFICSFDLQFPFPFDDRRNVCLAAAKLFENNTEYRILARPCFPFEYTGKFEILKKAQFPGDKQAHYIIAYFGGTIYTKLDDYSTKITKLFCTNMGGWVETMMTPSKKLVEHGLSMAKRYKEYFPKIRHETLKTRVDKLQNDFYGRILLANKEYLREILKEKLDI